MRFTSDYQPPVSLSAFARRAAGARGRFRRRTSFAPVRRPGAAAPEQPARSAEYAGADRAAAERDPQRGVLYQRRRARYLLANLTLAGRCGFKTVTPLLGKTSADVFPAQLGSGYTEQDLRVLRHGVLIRDQLEMHLYNGRETGWCLTQKLALYDAQGKIIGMAGISHDLQEAGAHHPAYQRLAAIDVHIRRHYARPIALEELTVLTGLSVAQIERYCKRIFHLTPRQMIHKVRLEKATELLAGDLPITDIALLCGYTDHSAFSRQFKAMTGSTPRDFRLTLSA